MDDIEVTIRVPVELAEALRASRTVLRGECWGTTPAERPTFHAAVLVLDALPAPPRPIAVGDRVWHVDPLWGAGTVRCIDDDEAWVLWNTGNRRAAKLRNLVHAEDGA